jgi:hypothetical protein
MTFCPGEDAPLSRELDLYDLAFLAWCGENPERALARIGISGASARRWLADPGRYLPERPELVPFYTVPGGEYIPREQEDISLAS